MAANYLMNNIHCGQCGLDRGVTAWEKKSVHHSSDLCKSEKSNEML